MVYFDLLRKKTEYLAQTVKKGAFYILCIGAIFLIAYQFFFSRSEESIQKIASSNSSNAPTPRIPSHVQYSKAFSKESNEKNNFYQHKLISQIEKGSGETQLGVVEEGEMHGPGSIIPLNDSQLAISDLYNNSIFIQNTEAPSSFKLKVAHYLRILGMTFHESSKELILLLKDNSEAGNPKVYISYIDLKEQDLYSEITLHNSIQIKNPPQELKYYSGTLKLRVLQEKILLSFFNYHYFIRNDGVLSDILPGYPVNKAEYLKITHNGTETSFVFLDVHSEVQKTFKHVNHYESLKNYDIVNERIFIEFDHFIPKEENKGKALQIAAIEIFNFDGKKLSSYINERKNFCLIDQDIHINKDGSILHLQAHAGGFDIVKATERKL